MALATELGREVGVPMRIANLVQQERAGIEPLHIDPAKIKAVVERDG